MSSTTKSFIYDLVYDDTNSTISDSINSTISDSISEILTSLQTNEKTTTGSYNNFTTTTSLYKNDITTPSFFNNDTITTSLPTNSSSPIYPDDMLGFTSACAFIIATLGTFGE